MKFDIKIHKNIPIKEPIMVAGWPGMGNVALGVVDYLKKKLGAVRFAEIKVDPMMLLDSVVVEAGVAKFPPVPQNAFYYAKNQNLVIVEGEAQIPGQGSIELLNKVLDFASELKTPRIYTGAAFPLPVSYKDTPQIYGVVNNQALLPIFKKLGILAMEDGHISGLNGIVLGFAKDRAIDAMCFLATMPQYAISLPNPKASMAIIDILKRQLKFEIDMGELEIFAKDMDEKMAVVEERVKDVLPIQKEESPPAHAEKKIPDYITEKIEKLFGEADIDRSKAIFLKRELDRWDLYKMYEDRFLDLFKDKQ